MVEITVEGRMLSLVKVSPEDHWDRWVTGLVMGAGCRIADHYGDEALIYGVLECLGAAYWDQRALS